MTIDKLVLVPITYWMQSGEVLTKDRIFTVGLDQVVSITEEADFSAFIVTLTDEDDEGTTIHRTIKIPTRQVRLIHRREEAV